MEHDRISTHIRRRFGVNVGTIREEKGLSQGDLALRAGVNRSYISRVENARCNITLDIMVKLADGLDVPLASLFSGLDHCPPNEILSYEYAVARIPRQV